MLVVFSHEKVLVDAVHVAVDGMITVRHEPDPGEFFRWWGALSEPVTAAIVDCRAPGDAGLATLDSAVRRLRGIPVLAVVNGDDPERVYRVGERGIAGWIPAPCSSVGVRERIIEAVGTVVRERPPVEAPPELSARLVGHSPAMVKLRRVVSRAAACTVPILVLGETGAGKEIVARAIHDLSGASAGSFVATNAAAISSSVFEAELFGARRGAYTGAVEREGLFQAADGGTLFIDEIGELTPDLQSKLLRAVETGEVRPVGGTRPQRVAPRIISATNRSASELRSPRRFRPDLWYRLAGVAIEVPPLRDRTEDIPTLAAAILAESDYRDVRLARSAEVALCSHTWPGNVRELRATLFRSVVLSGSRTLRDRDIVFDAVAPAVIGGDGDRTLE